MEWHIMNAGGVTSLCSALGNLEDDVYIPSDECEEILQDLCNEMHEEDQAQRLVRRQFLFLGIIDKDLVPLVKHVHDDPSVFSACIRLLAQATMPVDCLLSDFPKNGVPLPWIPDVQKMLIDARKYCTDYEFLNAFIKEIKTVIEDAGEYDFTDEDCDFINQGLILVRNLLHIADSKGESDTSNSQNDLLRSLFMCGLGDVVISLLSRGQRGYWTLTLIQLICLLYKGQVEKILSENESDDESMYNGESEHCGAECRMCASAGRFNFDSNDDSSSILDLNLEEINLNNNVGDSESEKMYKQFFENLGMESFESGGLESQKTSTDAARSPSSDQNVLNASNMSNSLKERLNNIHKNSIQEEVRCFLFEFTCNFIEHGFSNFIQDLKSILISAGDTSLDDSYLWSLSFFLKFARQQNMKFSYFRDIFEADLFGFLTYEGIYNLEYMLKRQKKMNQNDAYAKRINLTISALKEVFKTLAFHRDDPQLDKDDEIHLENLQANLANLKDMHQLFLLLIRHSNASADYLKDLIVTNHLLLVLLEKWNQKGYCSADHSMADLVQNFATPRVMQKFSTVLSDFVENGHMVNNCIFTMMHHVAGDCGNPEALLSNALLKTFLEIWDKKFYVTQETNDLMEYVIQKFVSKAEKDPVSCATQMFGDSTMYDSENSSGSEREEDGSDQGQTQPEEERVDNFWVKDEEDMLMQLFTELQDDPNVIEKMAERFEDLGIQKSESQIASQLCELDWLEDEQSENVAMEGIEKNTEKDVSLLNLTNLNEGEIVPYCVQKLTEAGKSKHLTWLQEILCEVAYVKLDSGMIEKRYIEQAVPKYYTLQSKSVPLVLYSDEQESLLKDPYFFTLILYLGLHTPEDVDMLFPRIPHFWSPEMLLDKAKQLGPLNTDNMKFDVSMVKDKVFNEVTKLVDDTSSYSMKNCSYDDLKNVTGKGMEISRVPGAMWIDAVQTYNNKQQIGMDTGTEKICVHKA